jgi:hypothetical protein
MQTMNQALVRLVERKVITRDTALATTSLRDELITLLDRAAAARATGAPPPTGPTAPRRAPMTQGVR